MGENKVIVQRELSTIKGAIINQSTIPTDCVLSNHPPAHSDGSCSWTELEEEILSRECCCCGKMGHYQRKLERYIKLNGIPGKIEIHPNGLVWDGRHRVLAAKRLGIKIIPITNTTKVEDE